MNGPTAACLLAALGAAAGRVSAPAPAGGGEPAPDPTSGGVYTMAQASQGMTTFAEACAVCHSSQEFAGRIFEIAWSGRSAADLYSFIRSTMPYDAPGRLSDQQYVDVVTYILQLNGHPTGADPLPPDLAVLAAVQLE